jgi:hypothetical protein
MSPFKLYLMDFMDFNQTHTIAPMCSIVVHHIFIFALSVRGSDRSTAHLDLCCNYNGYDNIKGELCQKISCSTCPSKSALVHTN